MVHVNCTHGKCNHNPQQKQPQTPLALTESVFPQTLPSEAGIDGRLPDG